MPFVPAFLIDITLSFRESALIGRCLGPRQRANLSAFIALCTDASGICQGNWNRKKNETQELQIGRKNSQVASLQQEGFARQS